MVLVVMGRRRAEYRRMEDDGTPSSGRGSTFGGAKTEPVKESVASPTGYIRVRLLVDPQNVFQSEYYVSCHLLSPGKVTLRPQMSIPQCPNGC